MLIVKNVSKNFGALKAINDISFKIKNGEITVLLGKNGAGKSTLLNIISGFMDSDSGCVLIDDLNVLDNRLQFLASIGYVSENSSLYADMLVFEYLEFVAQMRGIFKSQINRKILDICEKLNLKSVLMQKCETLSKGYKKRVEIAGALLSEPKILLFDEPTEGLDPLQKTDLHKILKALTKNHLILISTHLMEDVEALADKILLLDNGHLISDCKAVEFKKKTLIGWLPSNIKDNSNGTIF